MTFNAERVFKITVDGKDVYIKEAELEKSEVIKLNFRGKDLCVSIDEGIGLRDALLKALPLGIPEPKMAQEIKTIHLYEENWRLVDDNYRKGSMMISRRAVEAVLPVFKPNEEIDAIEVAKRLDTPKTSQLTNKLAILAQVGKLVRRKDKLRTLFRLKQFEYKPPAGIIKIDSGTSEEILQGIKESQRKDMEAMRSK